MYRGAKSVAPDQTAPEEAVLTGATLAVHVLVADEHFK